MVNHRMARPANGKAAQRVDARQLCLDLPAPRPRRGRPPTRYRQFLAYLRTMISERGAAPSYGQACRALGIGDRSTVRQLVVYGEQRGDMWRRSGGGVMLA